jgi:NDP-sugar pyrophosphorylase family protein
MVEIAGVPAVGYILRWLGDHGVTDVAINLHHCPDPLTAFVGDGSAFGLRVRYSREDRLLGSAGALRPLRDFFVAEPAFVVVYGDVLTGLDLGDVVAEHEGDDAEATLVVHEVDDPSQAGIVAFDDGRRITGFVEKPPRGRAASRWGNSGVYVCSGRLLDHVVARSDVPLDFGSDVFPARLSAGALLRARPTLALVIDFGSPAGLERAEAAVRAGRFTAGWSAVRQDVGGPSC